MKNLLLVSCALPLLYLSPALASGIDDAKTAFDLAQRKQVDAALMKFDSALLDQSLDEATRAKTYYNKGTLLIDAGRPDLALAAFDRVLVLEPTHVMALINRAEALRMSNKPKEALASLDKALQITPSMPDIHYARGLNLMTLNLPNDAQLAFKEATQRGDKPAYAVGLGRSLLVQKKLQAAKDVFDDVLAKHTDNAEAYLYRGLVFKGLGDKKSADKDLISAAHHDYNNPVIRAAYLERRFGKRPLFFTTMKEQEFLSAPKDKTPVLNKLPKDMTVEVASCDPLGWCRAMVGRRLIGYVKKSALRPVTDKTAAQ